MKPKKAIKELRRQLEATPQNLVARLRLAGLLCGIGEVAEAVTIYHGVASEYRARGRLSQAIAVCKSLLDIDPMHQGSQAMLAELEVARLELESQEARLQPPPAALPRSRRPHHSSGLAQAISRPGPSRITPRGKSDSLPPLLAGDGGSGVSRLSRGGDSSSVRLAPRRPEVEKTMIGAAPPPLSYVGPAPAAPDPADPRRRGRRSAPRPRPRDGDDIETRVADPVTAEVDEDEAPTRIADDPAWSALPLRAPAAHPALEPGDDDETRVPRRLPLRAETDEETGVVDPARIDEDGEQPTMIDGGARGRRRSSRAVDDDESSDETIDRSGPVAHAPTERFVAESVLEEVKSRATSRVRPARESRRGPLESRHTGRLRTPTGPKIDGALLEPFAGLAPAAVEELSRRVIERSVPSGEMILREGEPGDSCFVIASGEVSVLKRNPLEPHGELLEVSRLGEGDLFGEFALLADRCRHASVKALKACTLYEISRSVILLLGRDHPELESKLEVFYRQRMVDTLMATAPFFRPLSIATRRDVAAQFSIMRTQPGQRIVREGERSGGFYLVVLGSVEIEKRLGTGGAMPVASLGEGAYFGEMSLLRGDVARASVTAVGAVELAVLAPRRFYTLVAANPVLWAQVRDEANRREGETHRIVTGVTATV